MAWRTLDDGTSAVSGSNGYPMQAGMHVNSDTGQLVMMLSFSQLQSLKGSVTAARTSLKEARADRVKYFDDHVETVNTRGNGLKATTISGSLGVINSQATYDTTSAATLGQSIMERDRIEAERCGPAEEFQDALAAFLEPIVTVLSNEKLWQFLGGSENGMLALVLGGGLTQPAAPDLGPGA